MPPPRTIADRLREISGTVTTKPPPSPPAGDGTVERLRRLIARIESRPEARPQTRVRTPVPIEEVVAGTFVTTPCGPLFTTWSETPLSRPRGRGGVPLSALTSPIPRALASVTGTRELEGLSPERLIYLDTETTGLATTSGSFPFLVGLGFVEGSLFVVEQLFARDFDEEPALLWALAERLGRFDGLVTYNGRAFDIPLLEARFAVNRRFDPPIPRLHLDMLHLARKLWRARRVGCGLGNLESDVLNIERDLDVPGALIPGIYFAALRSGDARPLCPVFAHNVHDILSLAGLTAVALTLVGGEVVRSSIGEDVLSLARMVERSDPRRAAALYSAAAEAESRSALVREEALCRMGIVHRRLGNREHAVRAFSTLAEEGSLLRPFGLVELAKHYEHCERAFEKAVETAERAAASIRAMEMAGLQPPAEFRVTTEEVEYRLARVAARAKGLPWRRENAMTEGI